MARKAAASRRTPQTYSIGLNDDQGHFFRETTIRCLTYKLENRNIGQGKDVLSDVAESGRMK